MHSRDKRAAKRFFCKALKASYNSSPRVVNVDKNAAYAPAIDQLKASETLTQAMELRQNKYLNNLVEQDHRFIKKLVNLCSGLQIISYCQKNANWIRNYELYEKRSDPRTI